VARSRLAAARQGPVLDGDPGLGKSTLLLDIAARVTTHGVHFNNKQGPVGTVVLLSAEDGPEDTIKPRLEAASANPEMIIDLSDITVGDKQRPPEIPADLELIESVVREHKAKLLIIEPLAAFLAGPNANKDQEKAPGLGGQRLILRALLRTTKGPAV
jgi:RecA-family ATPase